VVALGAERFERLEPRGLDGEHAVDAPGRSAGVEAALDGARAPGVRPRLDPRVTGDGRPRAEGDLAEFAAIRLGRRDRQAGRLFDAAARFVRRHPGLSQVLRVRDHEGTIVREDGLGSIIRLTKIVVANSDLRDSYSR